MRGFKTRLYTMRERGFTLLEVICAISILTLGILAIASMQISAMRGNSKAGQLTEGVTWAQDKLEELAGCPFNHADLDQAANPHEDDVDSPAALAGYGIEWQVSLLANGAKQYTVTASWKDRAVGRTTELTCVKPQL